MYERGQIFKTHKGHFMCIGERKSGILAVNLNVTEPNDMIKIRVRNMFAAIEDLTYKDEWWMKTNKAVYVDTASTYEYFTVANAISNFITGVIIRDPKTGLLGYAEDIKELNNKIDKLEARKKALQEVMLDLEKRGKDIDDQMNDLKGIASEVDEEPPMEDIPDLEKFVPHIDVEENAEPVFKLEPEVKDSSPEGVSDTVEDHEFTNWYDLSTKTNSVYSCSAHRSSPAPKSPRNTYRMFREDEVCDIATMSSSAVALKYGVSRSMATVFIRNAKKIFEDLEYRAKKNDFVKYFENGVDIDTIAKETNTERSSVVAYHKSWANNKNATTSRTDAIKIWMDKAKTMSMSELAHIVFEVNALEFANDNNITKQTAEAIRAKIKREYLSRHPLIAAGFGKKAFDSEWLCNLASGKFDNNCESRIQHRIYDAVMPLYMAYTKSFDDHVDILYGKKPIPNYVPIDRKDDYMMLLRRRLENITKIYEDIRTKERNNIKHDDIAVKYMVPLASVRRTMSKV